MTERVNPYRTPSESVSWNGVSPQPPEDMSADEYRAGMRWLFPGEQRAIVELGFQMFSEIALTRTRREGFRVAMNHAKGIRESFRRLEREARGDNEEGVRW